MQFFLHSIVTDNIYIYIHQSSHIYHQHALYITSTRIFNKSIENPSQMHQSSTSQVYYYKFNITVSRRATLWSSQTRCSHCLRSWSCTMPCPQPWPWQPPPTTNQHVMLGTWLSTKQMMFLIYTEWINSDRISHVFSSADWNK